MNYDGVKCFFHVDLDAFFASVEQQEHSEWKGKPVVVGGIPGDRRAVVSTASYEARKFGVHSAMPLVKAVELCPGAVFVRGNNELYREYSEKIMKIFSEYSPDIRQISIDEAFLDMTGTGRLFGDPVETAKKLKEEVREKTGLTVSVGIATTAYISKISSGLKKPDGLFAVLPGDEEKFMLSLPLGKVWGIGEKTLTRLQNSGFKTTADIHKHSRELLASIFGDAQAAFLYNIVRGIEPPGFLAEAKSHSSGIETTYDYDLTDWTSIEAALLSLSEQLMFRLLRQNITGKTVAIKIRYEDFTTVSAQATGGQNITSVEDLYERTVEIFRKKYEAGRGIRLLGITINNTTDTDAEKQGMLFDFGEAKRKALEKSILKIQQKNPGIKIHKARLLDKPLKNTKAIFIASVLPLLLAGNRNIFADTKSSDTKTVEAKGAGSMAVGNELPPENIAGPQKLFDWSFNDNDVEFFAQGYWDTKLQQTLTASFGFGNSLALSAGTPVFKQQVDLSMWFMLNRHWYFETSFADEFKKNTIAAGWIKGEGYFKELRLSNRKIIFPTTYSVDDVGRGIGGGENQAPGIMASWGDPDGRWKLDAAIRYDMLTSHDKTYYGKNSVNDTKKAKNSFLTGRMFVLPSFETTASIDSVFVEVYGGEYSDDSGRKFKKLSSSDYLLVPSRKMLVLSDTAGTGIKNGVLPAVAVTFSSAATFTRLEGELGNFGTKDSPGNGFLGDTQKAFGKDLENGKPDVADFSYGKGDNSGFYGAIGGRKILYVQHPAGFSPFTVCYRYDMGSSKVDEIQVIHSESEKSLSTFTIVQADDNLSLTNRNFFSEKRYYADVYDTSASSGDYANPQLRYPFCGESPGTYLGYKDSNDIVIRSRNYTPVERFDIGTDAVSGTVTVYKNGVVDSSAKFNQETGEVTLSSAVNASDKIYIVWYEDSSSFDSGAIAGATGFNYNLSEKMTLDTSLATRWTISPDMNFAEKDKTYFGYATLAGRVKYEGENIRAYNTIAGTVENNNITGYYRVLGFNDVPTGTTYLPQDAGKNLPDGLAPVLNLRPATLGSIELDADYKCSAAAQSGSVDTEISGYKIPVSWNFTGSSEKEWAATTISLSGSSLSSASTFSVALKSDAAFTGDIYLQLGVNGSEDFTPETEKAYRIPTWKISEDGAGGVKTYFNKDLTGWQTVTVVLEDTDRARLSQYNNARIILLNKNKETGRETVWFGPYEIASQGIFTSQSEVFTVTKNQTIAVNSGASRFNKGKNYAQEVSWTSTEMSAPADTKVTMAKYFKEADASDYREISLFFKYDFYGNSLENAQDDNPTDEDAGLTFLLDTDAESITAEGKKAMKVLISKSALAPYKGGSWHLLTIDRFSKSVNIDGAAIDPSKYSLYINTSVVPNRTKIVFNTNDVSYWHKGGTFSIDEIYFSKTSPHFIVMNRNSVEYKKDGTILETQGGYSLLKDFKAHATSTESVTLYTKEDGRDNKCDISADAGINLTLAEINFEANIARTAGSSEPVSTASHLIKTASPILKSINFSEEYNFDNQGKTAEKINSAKINFSPIKIPLTISGKRKVKSNEWSLYSCSEEVLFLMLGDNRAGYTLSLTGQTEQKLLSSMGGESLDTKNYFTTWLDATKKEFSFGDAKASRRTVGAKIENTVFLPWADLKPKIDFITEEKYTVSINNYYTDKSVFEISIPFKIEANSLTLLWKKTSGGVKTTDRGGDYADDIKELLSNFNGRNYFFTAAPIHDLFSQSLPDKILDRTKGLEQDSGTESEYYSGEYEFSFTRPIYATGLDFVVPSSAALSFARDIRAAESLSDTYQIKTQLGWTAFNIFGKNGSIPITGWFEQDEYITSFIATLKIPRTDSGALTQVYTTYLQANFYITNDNILKNGFQLEFQDNNNFQIRATISYKRPGYLGSVPVSRTDSLNCSWRHSVGTSSDSVKKIHSYEYSHGADYKISRNFSLTSKIDFSFECIWNEICRLTATWALGGRLNFM